MIPRGEKIFSFYSFKSVWIVEHCENKRSFHRLEPLENRLWLAIPERLTRRCVSLQQRAPLVKQSELLLAFAFVNQSFSFLRYAKFHSTRLTVSRFLLEINSLWCHKGPWDFPNQPRLSVTFFLSPSKHGNSPTRERSMLLSKEHQPNATDSSDMETAGQTALWWLWWDCQWQITSPWGFLCFCHWNSSISGILFELPFLRLKRLWIEVWSFFSTEARER